MGDTAATPFTVAGPRVNDIYVADLHEALASLYACVAAVRQGRHAAVGIGGSTAAVLQNGHMHVPCRT